MGSGYLFNYRQLQCVLVEGIDNPPPRFYYGGVLRQGRLVWRRTTIRRGVYFEGVLRLGAYNLEACCDRGVYFGGVLLYVGVNFGGVLR